jgi:hypothetical protein
MNERGFVTVSMRELDRLKVIQAIVNRMLKPGLAAERLYLTIRRLQVHVSPRINLGCSPAIRSISSLMHPRKFATLRPNNFTLGRRYAKEHCDQLAQYRL